MAAFFFSPSIENLGKKKKLPMNLLANYKFDYLTLWHFSSAFFLHVRCFFKLNFNPSVYATLCPTVFALHFNHYSILLLNNVIKKGYKIFCCINILYLT